MPIKYRLVFRLVPVVMASWLLCLLAVDVAAQDKIDPTAESEVIKQTMSKILEVGKLDAYIEQNTALKATNKQLQTAVAAIQKQVAKLTADLTQQTAKLRKQLLQVPTFEVKSKIIGGGRDVAILKLKDRNIRIRLDTKMSVPVADGVWVLMEVKKISKDMIELYFPELEKPLYLYD